MVSDREKNCDASPNNSCDLHPLLKPCKPRQEATQSGKGLLTVVRIPKSCGCHELIMLNKGDCPVIINARRELSNLFIL